MFVSTICLQHPSPSTGKTAWKPPAMNNSIDCRAVSRMRNQRPRTLCPGTRHSKGESCRSARRPASENLGAALSFARFWCLLRSLKKNLYTGIRNASPTSHSGYCSATSMAHAPEPDPQSRILLGRGIGGNISLLSNIMLKIPCMYWSRSISSCLATTTHQTSNPENKSRQVLISHVVNRSEIYPVLQGVPLELPIGIDDDISVRIVDRDGLIIAVTGSAEFGTGVEWKHVGTGTTHPSFMVAATRL